MIFTYIYSRYFIFKNLSTTSFWKRNFLSPKLIWFHRRDSNITIYPLFNNKFSSSYPFLVYIYLILIFKSHQSLRFLQIVSSRLVPSPQMSKSEAIMKPLERFIYLNEKYVFSGRFGCFITLCQLKVWRSWCSLSVSKISTNNFFMFSTLASHVWIWSNNGTSIKIHLSQREACVLW